MDPQDQRLGSAVLMNAPFFQIFQCFLIYVSLRHPLMLETTVCKLDVNEPYVEWVRKFYNDETPARSAKGAKVIFRRVSNDNP